MSADLIAREQILALALRCGFAVEPHTGQVFVTDGSNEVQCTLGLEAFYHTALEAKDRESAELTRQRDEYWEAMQHPSYVVENALRAERDSLAEQVKTLRDALSFLSQMAQTTGDVAGVDAGLIDGIKMAEKALATGEK